MIAVIIQLSVHNFCPEADYPLRGICLVDPVSLAYNIDRSKKLYCGREKSCIETIGVLHNQGKRLLFVHTNFSV